jgi:DNA modification methylase
MKQPTKQVEELPTADLIPYARNAKKHDDAQIAKIAGSIREFGFNNPVLIDGKNGIIAGHGRVMAAQKLGLEQVPCIRLDHLSETQKQAYILADNRLAEIGGGWDMEALKIELKELADADIDLEALGFGEDFDLSVGGEQEQSDVDAEPQIDKAEELREKWGVETGQLWQLGEHRILCGDSTKAEDVARALDGAKPLLMVTDPPYGVEYDPSWRAEAGVNKNKDKMGKVANDDKADWREAWALFSGDALYVYHAGAFAGVVQDSIESCGFKIRAQIIWAKDRMALSRGDYHWQHEPCWYGVRDGKPGHRNDDRKQTTLWEIPSRDDSGHGHGTQKPVECMARPIRNHHSEFVYEPFSGSGTTIIACEQLGRKCRAIEISPAYVAVAIQRWADATGKEPKKL